MKKREKRFLSHVVELLVVVGFLCFAAGYMLTGGARERAEQYLIGENITVNVRKPGEVTYTTVELNSGMTVLDAVAKIMPVETEIYGWGVAVKSDDRWLTYTVNGADPGVGMMAYQLRGGENIALTLW